MHTFLMNRKRFAALIAVFLLGLGSGVMYAQSLPAQMVEMLLNAQFNKVKPESFHRVFQQWQGEECGFRHGMKKRSGANGELLKGIPTR
jgi:hypothetical protein